MSAGEMHSDRLEHLKMIQAVIDRMAKNSFQLKGWTVTLVSALFALAAVDSNPVFALIAIVPTLGFWYLDAFYLRQERLFRGLYDSVRQGSGPTDFAMKTDPATTPGSDLGTVGFSVTLSLFYGLAIAATFIAIAGIAFY